MPDVSDRLDILCIPCIYLGCDVLDPHVLDLLVSPAQFYNFNSFSGVGYENCRCNFTAVPCFDLLDIVMRVAFGFVPVTRQWCNLTLFSRFWATKMCLWASKISKICLFSRPTERATSWKENSEKYPRYSLIKWYQFLSA